MAPYRKIDHKASQELGKYQDWKINLSGGLILFQGEFTSVFRNSFQILPKNNLNKTWLEFEIKNKKYLPKI